MRTAFNRRFQRFTDIVTGVAGRPFALVAAMALIVGWLVTGPVFGFSDTWQLLINTTTTIVTFLMVFVIQATTNREARATQVKLDELIRAVHGARNELIEAERQSEDRLAERQAEIHRLARRDGANGRRSRRSSKAGS